MGRHALAVFRGLAILSLATSLNVARAEETQDLKTTMKKNFDALMNLQSYVVDPATFSDPKNRDEIQKNLDVISSLQHVFPQKMGELEPGLAAISNLFSDYLKDVQKAFKAGASGSYVRNQVRTMTAFCMSCHTRTSTNQSFTDLQSRVDSTSLTQVQRAEFYAATRQFDKAIKEFDKVISATPSGEFGYIEFGRSVREVLSITVRVKQDPKATMAILEKISVRKDIPEFFGRNIAEWKKDTAGWLKEKKQPKDMSATELMSKAKTLIDHGTRQQLFVVDPAGDVSFLRATSYIHEALQRDAKGKFRAEALYLLGTCYEALQDPTLWALDSLYYEACVREFPHTDSSRKCYRRYASKLYFGYSGSGGTSIPEDELKKLTELRKLAE